MSAPAVHIINVQQQHSHNAAMQAKIQSGSANAAERRSSFGVGSPSSTSLAMHLERSFSKDFEPKDLFQLHHLPLPISNYTRCVSRSTLVDILNALTGKLSAANFAHCTAPLTSNSTGSNSGSGMLIEFVGKYEGFALNGAIYVVKSGKTQYLVDFHKRKGDILIFGSLFRHLTASLAS